MMKGSYILFFILAMFIAASCTPEGDPATGAASYSCGVLSSEVISYSTGEMTLKIRYFVLDSKESDKLTKKDIETNLTLYSSDVAGTLTDNKEVTTPAYGNFSCAVLLDKIYNIVNYDYFLESGSTDTFIRKFFKNAGKGNSFLFSILEPQNPNIKIFGKGFTNDAASLDLPIAAYLNDVQEATSHFASIPLLKGIDNLLDTINITAPADNKHLILISSRNSYLNGQITKQSVIDKAKKYGIKVSVIMDFGGEYYIDYDLDNEDFFYKLADETGGFIYKNNDILGGDDVVILASGLTNILQGNFRCFESVWKIVPKGSWTGPFQPGFFAEGNLEVDMGTQYLSNVIEIPFGINIK